MFGKRWAIIVAVVITAVLLLTACPPSMGVTREIEVTRVVAGETIIEVVTATPPPTSPAGPKVLVVGQSQEPDTLYLYGTSMLAARHILHTLYDGPIDSRSFDYQPIIFNELPTLENGGAVMNTVTVKAGEQYVEAGELAVAEEDMELEQLVVTFKLKEGLLWEDDEPLTADDSLYAFELAADPDTPTSKYTIERTESYVALDDYTAVWTGLPGFMDATYYLNFWKPLPRHAMGDIAADDISKSDWARSPLSYGPFKMVEWVAGDHITVERNPNYFRADEGLPYLDKVIFKFIPDTNQLLAQLLAGEVDIGTQDGMDVNQSPFLLEAEAAGILKPYFISGTVWEHIDFNIQPMDDRIPFFADKLVRQAVVYGTDRQIMVDEILFGRTEVLHSYIPSVHPMYAPDMIEYPYSPEKAVQLLEEAGWDALNADGYRVNSADITIERQTWPDKTDTVTIPAGTLFEVSLDTTSSNKMREMLTQVFQQNMKDIGIKVNLEYFPASVWFEDGPDGSLFGRRFDLGEFAWLTGVEPPGQLYMCDSICGEGEPDGDRPYGWGGWNETGWCNPEYDEQVNKAWNTISREEQKPYWYAAQKMFAEGLPVMPLFARIKVAAAAPHVVGFIVDPTENSEMFNIEEFDIVP